MYSVAFEAVRKVDTAFIVIIGISLLILLFITFLMVYFLIRYRKSKNPVPSDIRGNTLLEIIWTTIPVLIVLSMFYFGWSGFKALRTVPKDATKISVKARMWSWLFEYGNGKKSNKLYVPLNKSILLELTSEDVIHSFYVPAFRIKMDTVPGMSTYAWLKAEKEGEFDIFCAEYCGRGHANMLSKLIVMPEDKFYAWLKEGEEAVQEARQILDTYGCLSCHSLDGTVLVGPSLKDIFGKEVTVLEDGKEKKIKVDGEYFKESVFFPEKKIVKGFDASMPSYDGQISDVELDKIIHYLGEDYFEDNKSEHNDKGKQLVETEGCMSCHSTDGSIIVGPSFKGLINRQTNIKRDGKLISITADEDYLYNSIVKPDKDIVDGFDNIMPPYNHLSEEEIESIVKYLESLK